MKHIPHILTGSASVAGVVWLERVNQVVALGVGLVVLGWIWAIAAGPLRGWLAPGEAFPRGRAVRFYLGLLSFYLAVGSPLDQVARLAIERVDLGHRAATLEGGFPHSRHRRQERSHHHAGLVRPR